MSGIMSVGTNQVSATGLGAESAGENVSLLAARRLEIYAATIRRNLVAIRRLRAFHGQFLQVANTGASLEDLLVKVRAMEGRLRGEIPRLQEEAAAAPGRVEIEATLRTVLADIAEMTVLLQPPDSAAADALS